MKRESWNAAPNSTDFEVRPPPLSPVRDTHLNNSNQRVCNEWMFKHYLCDRRSHRVSQDVPGPSCDTRWLLRRLSVCSHRPPSNARRWLGLFPGVSRCRLAATGQRCIWTNGSHPETCRRDVLRCPSFADLMSDEIRETGGVHFNAGPPNTSFPNVRWNVRGKKQWTPVLHVPFVVKRLGFDRNPSILLAPPKKATQHFRLWLCSLLS